jgi:hypothetical protein
MYLTVFCQDVGTTTTTFGIQKLLSNMNTLILNYHDALMQQAATLTKHPELDYFSKFHTSAMFYVDYIEL